MAQWDHWSSLRIRLMNSSGTYVTGTLWQPAPSVYMKSINVTYDLEQEERETTGGGRYPSVRGWRAHLVLVIETLSGHFAGSGITATLESVIVAQKANVGSYFEVALKAIAGIDAYDYKRVNLLSGYNPEQFGVQAGLRLKLEFEGAALQSTFAPFDTSGGSW